MGLDILREPIPEHMMLEKTMAGRCMLVLLELPKEAVERDQQEFDSFREPASPRRLGTATKSGFADCGPRRVPSRPERPRMPATVGNCVWQRGRTR